MAIDNSNRYFYTRAEFKFGFWDGLTPPSDFYGPINFTKMEITNPKQSWTKLLSNMENSYGDLLDSQPTVTDPPALSCEFNSMTGNMFALFIGASTADISQTGAAIADEAITPAAGVWQFLANKYIEPDGTGTEIVFETALDVVVDNANFELDLINGMYRSLNATGDTATKVSYHTSTRTGEQYNAGLAQNKYVMFVGTATEMASSKRCSIVLNKASVIPDGTFDPVSNAYINGMLVGDLLLPSGYTSPWRFEYLNLSA